MQKKKTLGIISLGCDKNRVDSEKLLGARKKLLRGNKKTAQAANTVCAEGEDSLIDYFVRSILWSVRPSLSSI